MQPANPGPTDRRPWVYIASPFTKGDQALNLRFQCRVWDGLLASGVVWPIAPLWSQTQHLVAPRPWAEWIEYDLALIERAADAVLALTAVCERMGYSESRSKGRDAEVAAAKRFGKPVFFQVGALLDWAEQQVGRPSRQRRPATWWTESPAAKAAK